MSIYVCTTNCMYCTGVSWHSTRLPDYTAWCIHGFPVTYHKLYSNSIYFHTASNTLPTASNNHCLRIMWYYALTQLGKRLHQTLIEVHHLVMWLLLWNPYNRIDRLSYLGVACTLTTCPRIFSQFWHLVTSSGATTTPDPTYTARINTYLSLLHTYCTYTHRAISILSTHSAACKYVLWLRREMMVYCISVWLIALLLCLLLNAQSVYSAVLWASWP